MKFRTMSVAASTVNRILNIADELNAGRAAQGPQGANPAPMVPQAGMDGAKLSAALDAPTPPVEGTPELADAVIADGLGLGA